MKHNDIKRNNGMRDTMSATHGRHDSGGFAIRLQRVSGFAIRLLLIMVMITGGVSGAWGQTDYSGTYYIGSNAYDGEPTNTDNYYLCPTEGWAFYVSEGTPYCTVQGGDNGQPFLTTYQIKKNGYDTTKAKWTLTKVANSDYYYIQQTSTGKYIVSNGAVSSNPDRARVHLETINDPNNLDEREQFAIYLYSGHIVIKTMSINEHQSDVPSGSTHFGTHDDHKWFTVNQGNKPNLNGTNAKTDGPSGFVNTGGIVGIFTESDKYGDFYLEDYITRPTITYNASNLIVITPAQSGSVTIKYTTDESTPSSTNGETYTVPFDPPAGTTTIKAIVIVNGEESNVATFTPSFFLGSTHNYVIQSVACQFYYLIPNMKTTAADYPKNVSTLNVPCNTMVWNFENAVDNDGQYYYIHNSQGGYLYYTTTDNTDKYIFLQQDKDTNDDGYKFSISPHASGGFNLIPKNQTTPMNKTSVESSEGERLRAVKLAGNVGNATSRWNIIPYNNTTGIPQWTDKPFDESTNSVTHFYQITSVSQPTKPIILNNSGFIKSETPPATEYDDRKSMWVIKKVGQDTDGLLDYYTFQNAYTGDLLYYNGRGREITTSASPGVLQAGLPTTEGANVTWAHFVIVQTVSGYNIIPRVLVDKTKATARNSTQEAFNCINRANGGDWTGTFYDTDNGSRWTFDKQTDVACMDPVFEVSDGNITISCVTNASKIYINTADDTTPTTESTLYNPNTTSWSESSQLRVKAIAIVSDGTNTASSAVVTLLNKPDITLAAGPYEYKGTAWEPSLTVSIGESGSETTAPTSPATYTATYSSNVNVGTATVTLTDADPTDTWYIWNGSTTFTITQKAITITAASDTKGYDGTPLTNSGYTCSPALATGDSFESVTVTGSQTDVGSSSNVPSAAVIKNESDEDVTANYAITYTNGTLTVTLRSIGDGSLASGFTLEFGEGGTIILKDGEITLIKDTDYSIGSETTSESGKYSQRTVSGIGNYEGSFSIRNANVNFQNDGNGGTEYSATFVAENAAGPASNDPANGHALPEGITAYIITSISGNNANAEALEYIPEGIPVLLLSNAASAGFLAQDASGHTGITSTQISNNMLEEVTDNPSKHFNTREIYLLYKNEFVYNMDGYLAKGKIYLNPGHAAPSPSRLFIAWGHSTGIEDSQLSPLTAHHSGWYTLDGRRLNGKPAKKGLYIMDGKKKFMK